MRATEKEDLVGSDEQGGDEDLLVARFSGQPRVVNGSRPEENQVSRTSVSCLELRVGTLRHFAGVSRDDHLAAGAAPCRNAMSHQS
jgi:hypothetical protein